MRPLITASAAAALCATAGLPAAQPSYPARPIRTLVPFAPGGASHIALDAALDSSWRLEAMSDVSQIPRLLVFA